MLITRVELELVYLVTILTTLQGKWQFNISVNGEFIHFTHQQKSDVHDPLNMHVFIQSHQETTPFNMKHNSTCYSGKICPSRKLWNQCLNCEENIIHNHIWIPIYMFDDTHSGGSSSVMSLWPGWWNTIFWNFSIHKKFLSSTTVANSDKLSIFHQLTVLHIE